MPACVAISSSMSGLFVGGEKGLHVALEHGLERLLFLPLGVLRREGLDAVEGEGLRKIHRLLGPQRAVVVEGGDALGHRHKSRRAFPRHLFDEGDDGLLRCGVVPGWQGIGGEGRVREQQQNEQALRK